jgi:hypothetical protein
MSIRNLIRASDECGDSGLSASEEQVAFSRARGSPGHWLQRGVTARPSRPGQADEADQTDQTDQTDQADETDEAAAVNLLSATLAPEQFPRAVVVGRQARLGHPFIEEVVATGRPVAARPTAP